MDTSKMAFRSDTFLSDALEQISALDTFPLLGVCALAALSLLALLLLVKSVFKCLCKRSFPPQKKNVVYLYQYPVLPTWSGTPNGSSFCVKLEAYLNFAKIPYEVVSTLQTHESTGKSPWIRLNGESYPDSSLIISLLNNKFGINLDAHLSPVERATARAWTKLMEDSLYWCVVYSRWVDQPWLTNKMFLGIPFPLNYLIYPLIARAPKASLKGHGLGRLSRDEIYKSGYDDLKAISEFIGRKSFFMGEKPSLVDCSALGLLSSIIFAPFPTPLQSYCKMHLPNLVMYCQRAQAALFPNWNAAIELARSGGKQSKSKGL